MGVGLQNCREGSISTLQLFKLTGVALLFLKYCLKTRCGQLLIQYGHMYWSRLTCLAFCPETVSMNEHGVVTCPWTRPAALTEAASDLHWATRKDEKEDFLLTFENFKVVPNLVLMIHVSAQSTHKGLKSACWSEIVFRKSDLIPRAKWSLPTAIRENQSPRQTLIWQMHKRFKRAEVSFTFL